jgi:hypothetical protein
MKIEYTNGCTVSGLDIDEERFSDLTATKMQETKDALLKFLKRKKMDEYDLQELIIWVAATYGREEYVGYCDQCGDTIYKTTLTI